MTSQPNLDPAQKLASDLSSITSTPWKYDPATKAYSVSFDNVDR